jgi:hypothetical protein
MALLCTTEGCTLSLNHTGACDWPRGTKYDGGKPRPDLLDVAWVAELFDPYVSSIGLDVFSRVQDKSPDEWLKGTRAVAWTYPTVEAALIDVSRVLEYGTRKYAPNNWRKGIERERLQAAALRHWLAWRSGEVNDPESGLDHRAHCLCELMFLWCLHGQ